MAGGILGGSALRALKHHKYVSGGYTPLDHLFYKVWWDPALSLIPLWMAPNLITLVGFIFALSACIFVLAYNPSLGPNGETVLTTYTGACFTFYMMMDALDGRQARRTRSGSPLGQLFDHGCDSVLAGFLPALICSGLGLGLDNLVLLTAASQVLFFVGMWEERYIGQCRTTVFGLVGTSEYLSLFIGLQFASGHMPESIVGFFKTSMVPFVCASSVIGSATCIINVVRQRRSLRPLSDLLVICITNGSFLWLIPSLSSSVEMISLCLVNSFMVTLMVLSTMSKSSLISLMIKVGCIPLVLACTATLVYPEWASVILRVHGGGFSLFFFCFVWILVNQIKKYLKISVFSIETKNV